MSELAQLHPAAQVAFIVGATIVAVTVCWMLVRIGT